MAEVGVVPDPERGEAAGPWAGYVGEGGEECAVYCCREEEDGEC